MHIYTIYIYNVYIYTYVQQTATHILAIWQLETRTQQVTVTHDWHTYRYCERNKEL